MSAAIEIPDTATAEDLERLQKDLAARIEAKRREEMAQKFGQIDALAERLGLSKADLAAHYGGRKGGKRTPAAPKYRNPNNAAQTWAGRGKRPAWVQAHLDGGGKLADLAI